MGRHFAVLVLSVLLVAPAPAGAVGVYDDCVFAIGEDIGGAVLPNRPLYTMTVTAYASCLPYGDGRDDEWSVYACGVGIMPTGLAMFGPTYGQGRNEDGHDNPCWARTPPTLVTCEDGIPTRAAEAAYADGLAYSEPRILIEDQTLSANRLICGSPI